MKRKRFRFLFEWGKLCGKSSLRERLRVHVGCGENYDEEYFSCFNTIHTTSEDEFDMKFYIYTAASMLGRCGTSVDVSSLYFLHALNPYEKSKWGAGELVEFSTVQLKASHYLPSCRKRQHGKSRKLQVTHDAFQRLYCLILIFTAWMKCMYVSKHTH